MKYAIRTIIVIVIIIAVSFIYIESGTYNISAMVPHNSLTLMLINAVKDNSIEHHSKDIKVPNNLNDSSLVGIGFIHYRAMCQTCHGAPGIERSEIGKGLYPHPPNLAHSAKDMPAQQLFWITKNGIKLTGMPSFGKTHSDQKIWDIVAFMEKLPTMTKEQYRALNDSTKNESND